MNYFIWNGTDSRTMALIVSQLPPIERAPERAEQVTIPGKAGAVTFLEGEDIYEPILRECKVFAINDGSYRPCLAWLRGSGTVVFSNEPDRQYFARIMEGVKFEADGNSLREATIPFLCEPYKGQWPPESRVTIDNDDTVTVYNPGDVPAKPVIYMPNIDGEATITINGEVYTFFHGNETQGCLLDAESGILSIGTEYSATIFVPQMNGLPVLKKGNNTITVGGFTDAVVIEPRWRWV